MRQQEFAAGQADKQRVAKAAVVTQKTASARDALLRAPTAADARRIVQMQYDDPDLGPIRGRFGSLAQALAEVPEEPSAFQQYKEQEAMAMEAFLLSLTSGKLLLAHTELLLGLRCSLLGHCIGLHFLLALRVALKKICRATLVKKSKIKCHD